MSNIKTILWDFDGVIMNSNAVRDRGFEEVLKDYPKEQVDKLMEFHQENGGLSRYVKFRYFFEEVRGESITEDEVNFWAQKFSDIMLISLNNKNLLIEETVQFIKTNYKYYNMHIVSGSDQKELRFLNKELGTSEYFISIHGSPTPKKDLVADLISKHQYELRNTCLIGDSINDYEAANHNEIHFYGYNNKALSTHGIYVDSLINYKF